MTCISPRREPGCDLYVPAEGCGGQGTEDQLAVIPSVRFIPLSLIDHFNRAMLYRFVKYLS